MNMNEQSSFSEFERRMDKRFKKGKRLFGAWFVFCGLVGLASLGGAFWLIKYAIDKFAAG